jgi:hypothetical protein
VGYYTEFLFRATLKKDTPESVIDVLRFMIKSDRRFPAEIPDHPLFHCPRWRYMLHCSSASHITQWNPDLTRDEYGKWELWANSSFKNYGGESEAFVDWLRPYLDHFEGDFLGYAIGEDQEQPTLIYMTEPKITVVDAEPAQKELPFARKVLS